MGRTGQVVIALIAYTIFTLIVVTAPIDENISEVLSWGAAVVLIGWLAGTNYECRVFSFLRRR
jgi:uncharacterized BrkB/YihY/UPF0761 family membrane protein